MCVLSLGHFARSACAAGNSVRASTTQARVKKRFRVWGSFSVSALGFRDLTRVSGFWIQLTEQALNPKTSSTILNPYITLKPAHPRPLKARSFRTSLEYRPDRTGRSFGLAARVVSKLAGLLEVMWRPSNHQYRSLGPHDIPFPRVP